MADAFEWSHQDRRDFMRALVGLGLAGGTAVATWGLLEIAVPAARADTYVPSVCRFCGTGCSVLLGLKDGAIVDVRGNPEGHNRGLMCVKGSMLRALPTVPGRLTRPKIRREGRLVDATWDEAMTLVADRFSEIIAQDGPDAVAFYGSGQLLTEESYTANKLFKAGIGTNNVDGNPRLCMASAATGYVQVFGKDEPPGAYADIEHASCFFIIGANLFEAHPPLFERIRRRKEANPDATMICVDPRRTTTAERCDWHLPIRPGTDLLLLNAMAQVICAQEMYDRRFIERHVRFASAEGTVDFDAFRAFLDKDYTPAQVAEATGIPAQRIEEVAFRFARSPATMSLWTMGINQRTQGTALNAMLSSLHLLTGQICRPGATPFSVTGQPNACGGVRDTGALAHLLPNGRVVANADHRREMEALWGVPEGTISPRPGLHAVDLFKAMGEGSVQAALVMCTNPAQTLPSADRYCQAMRRAFLVVADVFEDTETAELADVLLPAALWIEKTGVYGQGERRYQLISQVQSPPGDARSDLEILVDLADRLGHGSLIKARTPQAVWDEWRRISASSLYNFEGITYRRLREGKGLQWPCPTTEHPGTVRRYVEGDDPLVSPGAGIEFYGQPDRRAVIRMEPYVPVPEQVSPQYPFVLTTGRVPEQWHTGTLTGRIAELAEASGPARLQIGAVDAFQLQIGNGDAVAIQSPYGTLTARAQVVDNLPPGLVFASFYDTRLLINRAVADHYDPVSKEPEYKITAVQVVKIED